MSQIQTGSEANAAALVGSLASFSLFDVLELLARTGHTGELQVVARGIDQRVWVDRGDLLDSTGAGSNSTALFELACVEEGWFYFTLTGALPEGTERVPVVSLLADLGPQVDEWRSLVAFLPFDARVSMSASTPAPAVQIRADQWQLLSLVGSPGRTIRAVIDTAEAHPLTTLRTLRELIDAQLVTMVLAAPSLPTHGSAAGLYSGTAPAPMASAPPYESTTTPLETGPVLATPPGVGDLEAARHLAAAPGDEPWADDASGEHAAAPNGPASGEDPSASASHARPAPPAGATPIPPPEGWVEHDESVEGPILSTTDSPPDTDTTRVPATVQAGGSVGGPSSNGSAMPPPISGDPWSSAGAAERSAED